MGSPKQSQPRPSAVNATPEYDQAFTAPESYDMATWSQGMSMDPAIFRVTGNLDADLKTAFDYIVAQYGNPTVVRIFCNDPIKGDALQARLAALPTLEKLKDEENKLRLVVQRHRSALVALRRLTAEADSLLETESPRSSRPNATSDDADEEEERTALAQTGAARTRPAKR